MGRYIPAILCIYWESGVALQVVPLSLSLSRVSMLGHNVQAHLPAPLYAFEPVLGPEGVPSTIIKLFVLVWHTGTTFSNEVSTGFTIEINGA